MYIIPTEWSGPQRFFFRFFCSFFLIYIFPFPLDSFPFVTELTSLNAKLTAWYTAIFEAYTNAWHVIIPWAGSHLLHLKNPITIFTNGSGDTTYDFVLLLTYFSLAILSAIAWSILDRRRTSYSTALYWIRVLVRYYLAINMLTYGFYKVFHLQMPFPYLTQLVQPFGDKSPMGLAWSFVGYSKAFSEFTGWGEVVGGVLLFFRRTTTLGALLSAVVMGNIVAINFCYDVPVKLFSSMLFLMSVFLAAPDAKRLSAVFLYNRSTEPYNQYYTLPKRWQRITRVILKWVFILYSVYSSLHGVLEGVKQYGDDSPKTALYGIYNTDLFVNNRDTIPPLTTDTTRWKQLIVQFEKYSVVKMMNDSIRRYNFLVDTSKKTVSAFFDTDTLHKAEFHYYQDTAWLNLEGKLRDDSLHIRLKKYDVQSFRLVNRGFHWINEYPFNR
jgi:uncharacterized membrane protein YphA (DoxX/SURF4 family)